MLRCGDLKKLDRNKDVMKTLCCRSHGWLPGSLDAEGGYFITITFGFKFLLFHKQVMYNIRPSKDRFKIWFEKVKQDIFY